MGKTSVKTACKPRFFRLEGATSAWRNSLYELVCNSIRFGGAIISLIFPKLMRSVARDGIWYLYYCPADSAGPFVFNKRHEARASVFSAEKLAGLKPPAAASMLRLLFILLFRFSLHAAAGNRTGGSGRRRKFPAAPAKSLLLDFDLGACVFQFLLGRVGVGLVRALQQRLGRAFNQGLGFRQTEAGLDFADGLDDGDLLVGWNRGENHVKGSLGFGRSSSSTGRGGSASGGNGDRRCGSNAPGL